MSDVQETGSVAKSIVPAKYRDKYKTGEKDWLAQFIQNQITETTKVKKEVATKDGEGKETITVDQTSDIDIDKLFSLAETNGVVADRLSALRSQKDNPGFIGRARMTIRNMLQPIVKQRHGLNGLDSKWHAADAAFLTAKGAPEAPTHKKDGTKIEKPKAAAPAPATETGDKTEVKSAPKGKGAAKAS